MTSRQPHLSSFNAATRELPNAKSAYTGMRVFGPHAISIVSFTSAVHGLQSPSNARII